MTLKNNWLSDYSGNVYSQNGEDGILKKIFEVLNINKGWCVEFGAWDGKFLSNVCNLLKHGGWNGVMVEGSAKKFIDLKKQYSDNNKVYCLNNFVNFIGDNSLDNLLKTMPIPKDFDLLSIDIDGNDYHIWESLTDYKPKIVVIEFNPTIPNDIVFIQEKNMQINQGGSLLAMINIGKEKGYELICTTRTNAFFVIKEKYSLFNIVDNSANALCPFGIDNAPRVFNLYDGTIVLTKDIWVHWHGFEIDQESIQVLPKSLRVFSDTDVSSVRMAIKKVYTIAWKVSNEVKKILFKI